MSATPFKKTCPCTIFPPPSFNFSDSLPSPFREGNQNLQKGGTFTPCLNYVYCTHKILKIKAYMHNQIRIQSLKKYTSELLIKELKKINFTNYNIFSNVTIAYYLVEKILGWSIKLHLSKIQESKTTLRIGF